MHILLKNDNMLFSFVKAYVRNRDGDWAVFCAHRYEIASFFGFGMLLAY